MTIHFNTRGHTEMVAYAAPIHIHQGGTLNTYCGTPLAHSDWGHNVSWEQAEQSTCIPCLNAFFPAQSACR